MPPEHVCAAKPHPAPSFWSFPHILACAALRAALSPEPARPPFPAPAALTRPATLISALAPSRAPRDTLCEPPYVRTTDNLHLRLPPLCRRGWPCGPAPRGRPDPLLLRPAPCDYPEPIHTGSRVRVRVRVRARVRVRVRVRVIGFGYRVRVRPVGGDEP